MRAATLAVQAALLFGLVAVAMLATAEARLAARRARMVRRARRRAARTHVGPDEHPIGSVPGCPGCETWRDRVAARLRHPSPGPVRLTSIERTRIDGRWHP